MIASSLTLRRMVCAIAAAVLVAAVAAPAFAQLQPPTTRPQRPTRGIFASGIGETEQQLIFSAALGAGYDDDLLAESIGGDLPPSGSKPRSGKFGLGTMSFDYSMNRGRFSSGANASGAARYYPDLEDSELVTYALGGQASLQLTSRTSLATSHQLGVLPNNLRVFYALGFDSSTPPEAADDLSFTIGRRTYLDLRSSVGLNHELTSRLALSAGYSYYAADLRSDEPAYGGHHLNAGLNYRIANGLGARIAYGYSETSYGDEDALRHSGRTIDGGLVFDRALSLTRRTHLSFGTGVSGIRTGDDTRYFATGQATLTREMGRSWAASVSAARAVSFFQTFGEPVLSDTVQGGISGLLSRRVSVGVSAGWAQGSVGVVGGAPAFDSAHIGWRLRYALGRNVGLSVRHSLYRYEFDREPMLVNGIEREMKRQSVRVTLDFWAPLATQVRRANASR